MFAQPGQMPSIPKHGEVSLGQLPSFELFIFMCKVPLQPLRSCFMSSQKKPFSFLPLYKTLYQINDPILW